MILRKQKLNLSGDFISPQIDDSQTDTLISLYPLLQSLIKTVEVFTGMNHESGSHCLAQDDAALFQCQRTIARHEIRRTGNVCRNM